MQAGLHNLSPGHIMTRFTLLRDGYSVISGGGRVVRWSWVNFQCRGVLLIWIRIGQGPTTLAVGAGGGCLDIFSLVYYFSFLSLSLSLWETARYRLKYCLKGTLNPQQATNQLSFPVWQPSEVGSTLTGMNILI